MPPSPPPEQPQHGRGKRRRRPKSSSSSSRFTRHGANPNQSPSPTPGTVIQEQRDRRLKQKMRDADDIAVRVVGAADGSSTIRKGQSPKQNSAPAPGTTIQEQRDSRLKQKMRDADDIAIQVVGGDGSRTNKSQKQNSTSTAMDQDEGIKERLAKELAEELVLLEEEGSVVSSASYMAARTAPLVSGQVKQTSERRVSLQAGAYAIHSFNNANARDHDDPDHLAMEEKDGLIRESLFAASERDLPQDQQASFRSRGILHSSGCFSGHSSRNHNSVRFSEMNQEYQLSSESSSQVSSFYTTSSSDILEAHVMSMQDAQELEAHKQKERTERNKRTFFWGVAIACLVIPIVLVVCLILTRNKSSKEQEEQEQLEESATEAPTIAPTTPSPTFTNTVPVTVVIFFDRTPAETGWSLQCDDILFKQVQPGEYYSKQGGDYIADTTQVPEGADCLFSIFDTAVDGLCCAAGRGFYQVYLAEQIDVPNGLVGEGSEFEGSDTLAFVAT